MEFHGVFEIPLSVYKWNSVLLGIGHFSLAQSEFQPHRPLKVWFSVTPCWPQAWPSAAASLGWSKST